MATLLSRRALLQGKVASATKAIRPPWAFEEERFLTLCRRCGDCIDQCPESIIQKGDGGYPAINFKRGECTFCGDCVAACSSGALRQTAMHDALPPWTLTPKISNSCLAFNRVECRSCAEQCDAQVIRFRPSPGGIARPELTPQECSGCGACIAPCPVGAIELNSIPLPGTPGGQMQERTR